MFAFGNGAGSQETVMSLGSRLGAVPRLLIAVGLVISSLLMGTISASADASSAGGRNTVTAAVPAYGANQIPEYYQFCYDRTPAQKLSQSGRKLTTSATPRHWYKTAVASSKGVECQYMYAIMDLVPVTKKVTHSWTTVCKAMKLGQKGSWDAKRKYPYCTK